MKGLKGLLGYLSIRLAAGIIGVLPKALAQRLGSFGGLVWHRLDSRRREMTRRHMTRVLGDTGEPESAARSVMASYGRYWAEVLWIRKKRVPEIMAGTAIDGVENIVNARTGGRGVIFGLPHMGNWEAAAPVSGGVDVPVVAVAERLPNKRVTEWFTGMREEFGIEVVLATGSVEVMRRLEAALAANKAVALLSDRDLRGRGVEVTFFGEKTTFPPGPASLAIKTGAPLLPIASYFEGTGHRVVIGPPLAMPQAGPRAEQVRILTQALAHEMETMIRRQPRQWHLVVPNWPSDKV